jgi:flagellar motor protein MotB
MRGRIVEQRFTVLEVPASNSHPGVLAFTAEGDGECKNFNGRSFVMVDVVETQAMAQTMDEIGKLLVANKSLRLLVVGHTDNVGGFAPNVDLSKRRAEAVVAQLVAQFRIDAKRLQAFGVSYASPIASNADDAGRAKNRRVELVAN